MTFNRSLKSSVITLSNREHMIYQQASIKQDLYTTSQYLAVSYNA